MVHIDLRVTFVQNNDIFNYYIFCNYCTLSQIPTIHTKATVVDIGAI